MQNQVKAVLKKMLVQSVKISAEFYFEIDTMVKDYDNIVREQALPVVQEEVIKFTNKVLSGMGYEEFLHAQK